MRKKKKHLPIDSQDSLSIKADDGKRNADSETKQKRVRKRRLFGILKSGLDNLPRRVSESIPVKMLCFFGCADEKLRRNADGSLLLRGMSSLRIRSRIVSPMKRRFASGIENSRVLELIVRILNFFYTMPIFYFGIMLFTAGLTLCGTAAVTGIMQGMQELLSLAVLDLPMMIPGIILLLLSLPLLLAENKPLSKMVEESRFGKNFLCGFLGLDPVSLRREKGNTHAGGLLSVVSLMMGVFSGAVTQYVNPLLVPSVLSVLLLCIVVMSAPEAGLMLLGALLPLLRPIQLYFITCLILFSFALKLLRGKRSLRLTMTDGAFLLMAIVIFFHCVVFDGGKEFAHMAILCCLISVTGSHLLRSHGVTNRFRRALTFSALLSILAIAVDIALTYVPAWVIRDIPLSAFSECVIGNFGSRSGVGLYLFLLFPFVLATFYLSNKMRTRFRYLVYAALILTALVMTESRTLLVGSILLLAMFLLMRSPRHLITVLLGGIASAVVYFFALPDRYTDMVANHFADAGSHVMSGFAEFGDVFLESMGRYFTGVGFIEAEGNNLYTILLSALGLIGFVLFIVMMLLLIGYATVSTLRNRSASPKLYPVMIACYTSIAGTLLISARMTVLDSPGVLSAFCLICGFMMGIGRTMRKHAILAEAETEVDIEFLPIFRQGGDRYE